MIIVTGNADFRLAREALELGAVAYVDKPFDLADLKRMVALALRSETETTLRRPALALPDVETLAVHSKVMPAFHGDRDYTLTFLRDGCAAAVTLLAVTQTVLDVRDATTGKTAILEPLFE